MNIEAIPGYLIFFDSVRVDPLVRSFSCTISNDSSINRANIDIIALPEMDSVAKYSEQGVLLSKEDAVENMTNVKIFIKNVFSGFYVLVFDGNIRSKTHVKSPGGNYLSYGAIDHMEGITKTIAPIAIPFKETTGFSQIEFRLRSQGIEAEKIRSLTSEGEIDFKGKTIQQILDILKTQALVYNKVYSDLRGVSRWNNPVDRIKVVGDISETLRDLDILDLRLGANNLNADNLYVIFNDILQKLMFEFFQDREGIIKIKPPFWNEKIPLNHVIDASLITDSSIHTAWESMVTRVLSIGGVARSQESSLSNNLSRSLFLPMGAYLGGDNGRGGFWSTMFTVGQPDAQSSGSQVVKNIEDKYIPNPTEFELKYGIAVFEAIQPLIKYANESAFKGEDAQETLRRYSTFMHSMVNAMAKSARVQMIGAPWLRPGMNCLVSPIDIDIVYYIASVSHSGDPQTGVHTTLSLVHGRPGDTFFFDKNSFGAMKENRDNIFINNINRDFLPENHFSGKVLHTGEEYTKLKADLLRVHSDSGEQLLKAEKAPILKDLYGQARSTRTMLNVPDGGTPGTVFDFIFDKEYSLDEIQRILDELYRRAPTIVKSRRDKIKQAFAIATRNAHKRFTGVGFLEKGR